MSSRISRKFVMCAAIGLVALPSALCQSLRGAERQLSDLPPGKANNITSELEAAKSNLTALWGWDWGSCEQYGCGPFRWGQLCGCEPRCLDWGTCCSDYTQACHAPAPAPSPSPSPASCAAYGCGSAYSRQRSCQCNEQCTRHGNCCADYADECQVPPTTSPTSPPAPAPVGPSDGTLYSFYVYRPRAARAIRQRTSTQRTWQESCGTCSMR